MKKVTQAFYIPEKQAVWLEDMAELNMRSKSYFVCLALEKLIEMTGGYTDEQEKL